MQRQIRSLATLIMFTVSFATAASAGVYIRGKEYETKQIDVAGQIQTYAPRLISMQTIPYADTSKVNGVLRQNGYKILICRQFGRTGHYSFLIEGPEAEDSFYSAPMIKANENLSNEIDYCIPSSTGGSPATNDTHFGKQYYLHTPGDVDIDAPEAWEITTGSNEVRIAILDTGIYMAGNHQDLLHEDLDDLNHIILLPN